MAHFAQLDENNVVLQIVVVNNDELTAPDGAEYEGKGIDFCKALFGADTIWKQTSYNKKFRKNYAGIGFTYNADLDAFVPPSPYDSWILNVETAQWEPPIKYPVDGKRYRWDEPTTSWVEFALQDLV